MGQMGFYDLANRYAELDAKNEPLVKIDEAVPWEDFRGRLDAERLRKVRQGVMANRSDRDPPSLNVVEGREAHRANEARIGRFHQGQRAESLGAGWCRAVANVSQREIVPAYSPRLGHDSRPG